MHQQKLHQFKNNYTFPEILPIIQHTDVTLNTKKKEPFTQFNHDAKYAELINSIKLPLPAMDDFISKSPTLYNYFYEEQIEINDTLLYETQQQDAVLLETFTLETLQKFLPSPFTKYTSEQRITTLL